jgi:methionyl-tRNA formyltransferase
MKIIFMGTPEFSVPSLKRLIEDNEIVAVVTTPDKAKGRGLRIQYSDVKKFALDKNVQILQPNSLKDDNFISQIKSLNPDLIIVVAFRILPKEIFSIPKFGSFNLHASLLPKYRGAAPINWALINGENETGVTTFFLQEKVDTGNIILQEKIKIENEDDAGTIHDKLSTIGADLVIKTVKLIEQGNLNLKKQDENLTTKAPKIFKGDCIIDWNLDDKIIHNLIRGLSPYPAAYTNFDDKTAKIFKSKLTDMLSNSRPGQIYIDNNNLFVNTSGNLLQIVELQLEGKKRIASSDFINGLNKSKEIKFY